MYVYVYTKYISIENALSNLLLIEYNLGVKGKTVGLQKMVLKRNVPPYPLTARGPTPQ